MILYKPSKLEIITWDENSVISKSYQVAFSEVMYVKGKSIGVGAGSKPALENKG